MPRTRGPTWQPGPSDFERALLDQNPWHGSGRVPDALAMAVERPLAQLLWRAINREAPKRYELVLGPRRVGKTTAMYQTVRTLLGSGVPANKLWWLRLDHPILMQVELGTLVKSALTSSAASAKSPLYLFFDELTYARGWDLWLKTFFDEQWPIRIAGTSSSTAALRERHVESGVGRWEEQYLAPYLFDEYLDLAQAPSEIAAGEALASTLTSVAKEPAAGTNLVRHRQNFLLTGGFPELLLATAPDTDEETRLLRSQRVLRSDAVERAIYKDIPQAFGVDDPLMLERLLYTLGGQLTGILSPSAICATLGGLSQPTFDRYLAYLERAFLVFTLPNYSGNETTVQRRGRKLYFVDGAVRNAALQRGTAPLTDPAEMGLLLENAAASHLHALSHQSQVRLYHWRDQRDEVDLVYDDPNGPLAFEIGSSLQHARRGLLAFAQRHPRFSGGLWLVAPNLPSRPPGKDGDPVGTVSLELFLAAVGRQAAAALANRLAR